ncbi:MAG: putative outer membrane repeat protein [Planctomycetota bacterium]|jgi:predicted outer membrane repeat protein
MQGSSWFATIGLLEILKIGWRFIHMRHFFSVLLASACLMGSANADVLVVAADGSGSFLTIQSAVTSASDRDVILVKSGLYSGFQIDGKALTVTAEANSRFDVEGTVFVQNLGSVQTVLFAGLDVLGEYDGLGAVGDGLILKDNQGRVRAQDCSFTASQDEPPAAAADSSGREGALIENCADVIFTHCSFLGGEGLWNTSCCTPGFEGGNGALFEDSKVALYDCDLNGHKGPENGWGGPGGAGLLVRSMFTYVSGCSLDGGRGGTGVDEAGGILHAGDGGDGLHADSGSVVRLVDVDLSFGGVGSPGFPGGVHGFEIGGAGDVQVFETAARSLVAGNLTWSGSALGVQINGEPGDRVRLLSSLGTSWRFDPLRNGVWALRFPLNVQAVPVGAGVGGTITIPASGLATVLLDVADLPASQEANSWYIQGVVSDGSGSSHLTGPLVVTRMQCGFSADCNGNENPDGCEITGATAADCNGNGIPDSCDLSSQESTDCNRNGIPDACDLLSGVSSDCDGDMLPDECAIDCNTNGVPDLCDISTGSSSDFNGNLVPDECQSASDIYYASAAGVAWGDGTLANPFDTIGQALAYAIDGNTIVVQDGTYTGEENRGMSFDGRNIHVKSQNGPLLCTIDLELNGRAFVLKSGETRLARIDGFTIQNARLTLSNGANGVDGTEGGGAIFVRNSSPIIENCVFLNNKAKDGDGGAVAFRGVLPSNSPGPLVRSCEFHYNRANNGGAISHAPNLGADDLLTVEDSVFRDNIAFGLSGGAISSQNVSNQIRLVRVDVRNNSAESTGGGLDLNDVSAVILDSVIAENEAFISGGLSVVSRADFHMSHTILAANSATIVGGLSVWTVEPTSKVSIDNCLIFGNIAAGHSGGILMNAAGGASITNCSFFLNEATNGGGLVLNSSEGADVRNCLFWENQATVDGPQIHVLDGASVNVDYCNLQGGSTGIDTVNLAVLIYGSHNSGVYPGFIDPSGPDDDITTWEDNDVRLGPSSVARDAGDNTVVPLDIFDLDGDSNTTEPVPIDLAGESRFVDSDQPDTGVGPAPIVDLGCYEDQ